MESGATGTVVVAPGIPAIKKWLAESILAGECIYLAELPPAKGRGKNLSGPLEGQVVLLHAADTRPGQLATVFCPVRGNHRHQTPRKDDFPVNVHGINCKAEPKFKWPSWVIYDHSYRQDAAENNKTDQSKVVAGLHAQCFNGMAKSAEGWCCYCHSLDHISPAGPPICKKYKYNGDCNFAALANSSTYAATVKAPIQYQSAPSPRTHLSRREGSMAWLACRDC